jgi:hypothetical protein
MWGDRNSVEIRPPIKIERSRAQVQVYDAMPLAAHGHAHAEVNLRMLMARLGCAYIG